MIFERAPSALVRLARCWVFRLSLLFPKRQVAGNVVGYTVAAVLHIAFAIFWD